MPHDCEGHLTYPAGAASAGPSARSEMGRVSRTRRQCVTTTVTAPYDGPSRPASIAQAFLAQAVEGAGVARPEGTLSLLVVVEPAAIRALLRWCRAHMVAVNLTLASQIVATRLQSSTKRQRNARECTDETDELYK